MKKIINTLVAFLFIAVIAVGCGGGKSKEKVKVALLYGDMNASSAKQYELAGTEDLDAKLAKHENFLLFVYDDFCECSQSFEGVIEHFMQEKHLIVYTISNTKVNGNEDLKNLVSNSPALVLYENGTISSKVGYKGHESYFENYAGFQSYLDKYVIMPSMFYINEAQLDAKLAANETFVIYYDKANCPFCAYLKEHYLKEYMIANPNNVFYAIDVYVEGIQIKNGSSSSAEAVAQFTAFKAKYKLSDLDAEHPNPYGFTKGWNPSMHSYKNGVLSGAFIQSNEKTSSKDEAGNTYYTITRSYYSDNPFVGQTLAYSVYNDTMAEFYKGKLYSFMNEAFN